MIWLLPSALAGLFLLAGPVAIHLLTRRRAPRVLFPTIRFLRESRSSAVRPRRPSDLGLLLIRLAIVAAAVIALAQPVFLSGPRLAAWNRRGARAVVIDSSASMSQANDDAEPSLTVARTMAAEEQRRAFASVRVETPNVEDGLASAARRLDAMPPARREIVVFSDFQQGSLSERAIAAVPPEIGLRFVRIGTLPSSRTWTEGQLSAWRGRRWQQDVSIDPQSTAATWTHLGDAGASPGITLAVIPAEEEQARMALHAAQSLGAFDDSDNRQIVIQFRGAPRPSGFARAQQIRTPWIARAIRMISQSDLLREALDETLVEGRADVQDPWISIARDARGRHVVLAAESNRALLMETTASASSVFAPALVRAALLSRVDSGQEHEAEILRIPDDRLARWRRDPGAVTTGAAPRVDRSDARWFWAAALVLLAVEGLMRRRQKAESSEALDVRAA
jgi:Aerotolerance regulator N-terminal